jgi:hypothetical protein
LTADDLYRLLNSGGVVALLALILFGGWKEQPWWVFGREYRRCSAELEHWRDIAMRGMQTTERAVRTIETEHAGDR